MLAASLALAARQPLVKGFAIGRTIFADAARAWLAGRMTDAEAVARMADRYARLSALWDTTREAATRPTSAPGAPVN
jgi:5-dehydro-2-deoxygluconokinase